MTSAGSRPGFMSALLTFILPSAIVVPSRVLRKLIPRAVRFAKAGTGVQDRSRASGLARPCREGGGLDGDPDGPARWLDLVRWRTHTLEGRENPRPDARPALRQHGVRGRARLWRRNLQVARAHRTPDPLGEATRFRHSVFRRRDRSRQAAGARK